MALTECARLSCPVAYDGLPEGRFEHKVAGSVGAVFPGVTRTGDTRRTMAAWHKATEGLALHTYPCVKLTPYFRSAFARCR